MDINRSMLAVQLADRMGYSKKEAKAVIDGIFDLIVENIQDGNSVSIYGFGCFDLLERKARVCPNMRLGIMVDVPTHYIPRFYPGARMQNAVKTWEAGEKKVGD